MLFIAAFELSKKMYSDEKKKYHSKIPDLHSCDGLRYVCVSALLSFLMHTGLNNNEPDLTCLYLNIY